MGFRDELYISLAVCGAKEYRETQGASDCIDDTSSVLDIALNHTQEAQPVFLSKHGIERHEMVPCIRFAANWSSMRSLGATPLAE